MDGLNAMLFTMRSFALTLGVAIAACSSDSQPPGIGGNGHVVGGGGGGGDGGTSDAGTAQDTGTVGAVLDQFTLDTAAVDGGLIAGPVRGSVMLFGGNPYVVEVKGTYSAWSSASWQQPCGGTPENGPMFASTNGETGKVGKDAAG